MDVEHNLLCKAFWDEGASAGQFCYGSGRMRRWGREAPPLIVDWEWESCNRWMRKECSAHTPISEVRRDARCEKFNTMSKKQPSPAASSCRLRVLPFTPQRGFLIIRGAHPRTHTQLDMSNGMFNKTRVQLLFCFQEGTGPMHGVLPCCAGRRHFHVSTVHQRRDLRHTDAANLAL